MKTILEELFYGNVCPCDDGRCYNQETRQLMGYIADHHEKLLFSLNEQEKELFDKFNDCCNELSSINERDIFVYAFTLGARLMLEVMCEETK